MKKQNVTAKRKPKAKNVSVVLLRSIDPEVIRVIENKKPGQTEVNQTACSSLDRSASMARIALLAGRGICCVGKAPSSVVPVQEPG
ncbi:MAG: hypothetical protein LKM36_02710 [Flavobacteriales bacterium]|nr:hypothetical protein [Flavobacteriales bacterium]